MRKLLVLSLLSLGIGTVQANAVRTERPNQNKVWFNQDLKQVQAQDLYRDMDRKVYECTLKEVVINEANGKPSLKPVK